MMAMTPATAMQRIALVLSLLLLTNTSPTFLKSLIGPVKNFMSEYARP